MMTSKLRFPDTDKLELRLLFLGLRSMDNLGNSWLVQ